MELAVQVQTPEDAQRETLATYTDLICNLARATSLDISVPADKPKSSAAVIVEGATVLVNLEGIIDFAREAARLDKEIAKIAKELQGVSKKLSNEGFLGKAPADVIEKVRAKHQMLTEKQEKLQASKERLQGMV